MILREIALAAMVGVLIVIGLAVALIRKWARSNEGSLSDRWEPDQEQAREHRMKARNE